MTDDDWDDIGDLNTCSGCRQIIAPGGHERDVCLTCRQRRERNRDTIKTTALVLLSQMTLDDACDHVTARRDRYRETGDHASAHEWEDVLAALPHYAHRRP